MEKARITCRDFFLKFWLEIYIFAEVKLKGNKSYEWGNH